MQITQERIDDLNAVLKVTVAPEDYRDQVKTVLKDYAKKANIKGFRKGKVPVSVVRKMFGKGVVFEELNKLISEELTNYIRGEKLPLVGEPLPLQSEDIDLDPESENEYEFAYEVGLAPAFSLDYGHAAAYPMYKVMIDEEILAKEIENMQKRYGPMTNPDESEEGDILYGKLSQLDADGNVVEDGYGKMFALNPERVPSDDIKAEMGKGKKAEDTFDVTLDQVMKDDAEIRNFWQTNVQGEQIREVSDEDLEALKGMTFRFEVRKINRVEPMEVGQELFDKAFGEGTIEDESAFRDRVSEDMGKFFNNESIKWYRTQVIKKLIEATEIPLPEEFLRKWLVRTREQVTEDNIGELFEPYTRSLRWRLIIEKMQEQDESLTVQPDEINARARGMVLQQFGQMIPEGDEERLDAFTQYYLQDEKMVDRIFDELLEDKVFSHLNAQEAPKEEEISATEFMEVLKAENAS